MDKRVFLLEDDKNIGELVTCALEMSNIETECYPTIAEFWDAVEKDPPRRRFWISCCPTGTGWTYWRNSNKNTRWSA